MELVSVDDVEPDAGEGDADRRGLTDPLGTTDVAINHYCLEPGERAAGLHAHADQEEVFLVVDGAATFETMEGEVAVGAGEAIRLAPGEFHSGVIATDGSVVALALGAPRDAEDVRIPLPCSEWIPLPCSECGHDDRRPGVAADGETPVLACPECGTETEATCPACGSNEMRAELAADGDAPAGVCVECGAQAGP